jgi:hypothetical protein
MSRVTGSIITVDRKTGPVLYIKARDRTGRQIKKRLGPEADWSKRASSLLQPPVDLWKSPPQVLQTPRRATLANSCAVMYERIRLAGFPLET